MYGNAHIIYEYSLAYNNQSVIDYVKYAIYQLSCTPAYVTCNEAPIYKMPRQAL